jgi:hypothetical protein
MDAPSRRTRHRRRFHTDRVVANRRARYQRERPPWQADYDPPGYLDKRLAYGRLADRDPWDCGRPRCGVCHYPDYGWRSREKRAWRHDWA